MPPRFHHSPSLAAAMLAALASRSALAASGPENQAGGTDISAILLAILGLIIFGGLVLAVIRFLHFNKTQEENYRQGLGQLEGELLRQMQPGSAGATGAVGGGAVVDNAPGAPAVPATAMPPETGDSETGDKGSQAPPADARQQIIERFRAGSLIASEDPPLPLPEGLPPATLLHLTNGKRVLVLPPGAPPLLALSMQREADWVVLCDDQGQALAARPLGDQLSDWLFSA